MLAFTKVQGYNEYVLFAWVYGLFSGGYSYSLKMYIYEKVRARNFARGWGFAQFAMSLPNAFGLMLSGNFKRVTLQHKRAFRACIPTSEYLSNTYGERAGYYLCGLSVILGCTVMSFIDVHKRNLRKRNRKRRQRGSRKSVENGLRTLPVNPPSMAGGDPSSHGHQAILDLAEYQSGQSSSSKHSYSIRALEADRKLSFSDQDDVLPPVSLLSQQRSFIYDDLIDSLKNAEQENSIFSEGEEGIADMELPAHLLIEELEYLDNITSCDKVENCVMLSEYEQNLIKEIESPMPSRRRKWSLFRQPSALFSMAPQDSSVEATGGQDDDEYHDHDRPERNINRVMGVGGLRQSSFYGDLPAIPAKSSSRTSKTRGPREIPTFANTARRWASARGGSGAPKRNITVIEEASV